MDRQSNSVRGIIGFLESRGFVFTLGKNSYFQHYTSTRRFIIKHNQDKGLVVYKVANICFGRLFTTDSSYMLTEHSKGGTLDWALSN